MLSGLMMDYPLTIDRVLEHGNRLYPNKQIKTKLPDGSLHVYTYRDLYRRVKRLCNLLEGLGVEPGDRVGTFAWNNYQHVELYFGAPGAGAGVAYAQHSPLPRAAGLHHQPRRGQGDLR